jgi:hypothetical protein
MTERLSDIELADMYVRNELTGDDEADFEVRMLQSPQLQQHVQTALAIKESLKLEEKLGESPSDIRNSEHHKSRNSWGQMALAASVLLAVVSTLMWAKTSIDSNQLKRQITELSQPQALVLTVPVNIMRSFGSDTPDVIVQKPSAGSVIQLDIELSGQSRAQPLLRFTLVSEGQESNVSWQASPSANGRSTVLIRSEQIPTGLVQLQISDVDGNVMDRHLLEFRPPLDQPNK